LLPIVTMTAATTNHSEFVRSNKHSERPEISALFGSKRGSFASRVQAH
jgi:hypothetical protein